ncbi:hypothetical protein AgCh_040000 [Apium graveolens]
MHSTIGKSRVSTSHGLRSSIANDHALGEASLAHSSASSLQNEQGFEVMVHDSNLGKSPPIQLEFPTSGEQHSVITTVQTVASVTAVRPEIPTPLILSANKTKGEIEARLLRSSVQARKGKSKETEQQIDVGMEMLLKAGDGPSLNREFDELLKARASLNNNFFTYKKALDKTINFIRVILVTRDNFQEKRIVTNINDSDLKTKQYKTVEDEDMIKLLGRYLKNAETNLPKTQINTNGDLDDDEKKKDDKKPSGYLELFWSN